MDRTEKRTFGVCYDCQQTALPNRRRCAVHLKGNMVGQLRYAETSKGVAAQKRKLPREALRRRLTRRTNERFTYARNLAGKRSKVWTLNETEYLNIIAQPCTYCGLLNNVETGVGLDRIDNSRGYHPDNVLSCCLECNLARNNRFTVEEMKIIGKAIRHVKLGRETSVLLS